MATNDVQLDNGKCGQNLQVGNDHTASHVANPSFYLQGDGGLSKYRASIDGVDIGEFDSLGDGTVCIITPNNLNEGAHQLDVQQLSPTGTGNPPPKPFKFSVDTVRPNPPSTPILSTYSDSGTQGDHHTIYRNPNFKGTASGAVSVQIMDGPTVYGGGVVDANGNYSVTTTELTVGRKYLFSVRSFDSAGNISDPSGTFELTIDPTDQPTGVPSAPTMFNNPRLLGWLAPTTDGGSPITSYNVYRNGQLLANVTDSISYVDNHPVVGGRYAVAAVNANGEGALSPEV